MKKQTYTTVAVVSLVTLGAALGIFAAMYCTQGNQAPDSYDGDSPLFI